MGGGGKGGSTTTQQATDPRIVDAYLDNLNRARSTAGTLGPRQFAPESPFYQGGREMLGTTLGFPGSGAPTGGAGMASTNEATNILRSLAGMQPDRISAMSTMEAMPGMYGGASIAAPGQIADTDLMRYMSPYQQSVIDLGQQDIERQRQMASASMGARAQAAGAFGGSRQAVQEGVLGGEAARAAAMLSAQQRQAGFETALGSAQFDIGQRQLADTLQAQLEQQAGLAGQATTAELLQADQRAAMQADMANLEAQFRAAGLDQQTARQLAEVGAQQQLMGLQGTEAMLNLGLADQRFAQEQLDAIRNLPIEQQRFINEALGLYPPGGGGTSTTTQQESLLGPLATLGAAAIAGPAASDRRLKENIVPLGKEPTTGLPWYEFSYLGDDKRYQGVMADEVEEVYPDAVVVMENGYKAVKYGALGIEMLEVSS